MAENSSLAGTQADTDSLMDADLDMVPVNNAPLTGEKSKGLDKRFFGPGQGMARTNLPFHHKYSEQGKELTGRKLKAITALEKDVDPAELQLNSKKHFKANKKRAKKVKTEYD
jgi:large subunit GTPase 1